MSEREINKEIFSLESIRSISEEIDSVKTDIETFKKAIESCTKEQEILRKRKSGFVTGLKVLQERLSELQKKSKHGLNL